MSGMRLDTTTSPFASFVGGLNIDFSTQAGSYPGASVARTGGNAVCSSSASAAAIFTAANPTWENRGDGVNVGLWTFPAFTNNAPQDFSTWTGIGSVARTLLGVGSAPDGVSAAYEVNDTDAASASGITTALTLASRVQSVWVRDHAGAAPSAPGVLWNGVATQGAALGSGLTWRRVTYGIAGVGTAGSTTAAMTILPAGQTVAGATTATATGAVDVFAPSSVSFPDPTPPYGGTVDLPTIIGTGSTSAQTIQLDQTRIVFGGDLDVELTGTLMFGGNDSLFGADVYLFSMTSADGLTSLRYSNNAGFGSTEFVLTVRGVDVLRTSTNTQFQYHVAGDDFTARFWYRPSTGKCAMRIMLNGSTVEQYGTTTGVALAQPTSAWLGSNLGTSGHAAILHSKFQSHALTDVAVVTTDFLCIGDSIGTGFQRARSPFEWIYLRDASRRTKAGNVNQAVVGQNIAQQKAIWDASPHKGKSYLKAVIIQVGINDLNVGRVNLATFVASYQGLVNDIRASSASVKIVGCELSPCKAYLDSLDVALYPTWLTINTSIGGGGGSPITGLDLVISSHVAALNDGAGNLAAAYNTEGDNLHPDDPGRQVIGLAIRTGLLSLGLVT